MNNKIKLILLILTVCVSCNNGQDPSRSGYVYTIPAEFDDGIETASLKSVGRSVYVHYTRDGTDCRVQLRQLPGFPPDINDQSVRKLYS